MNVSSKSYLLGIEVNLIAWAQDWAAVLKQLLIRQASEWLLVTNKVTWVCAATHFLNFLHQWQEQD